MITAPPLTPPNQTPDVSSTGKRLFSQITDFSSHGSSVSFVLSVSHPPFPLFGSYHDSRLLKPSLASGMEHSF
ncbi:unnamed protein product [Mortierella alpina]